MSATPKHLLVAIYPTQGQAEAAIDQLWHSGLTKDQISVFVPGVGMEPAHTKTEAIEDRGAAGAAKGALAGSVIGTLAGTMAMILIPGLGPILTGGALMGVAAGAAAGAALGSFAGPFVAMGFSEEAERHYLSDLRLGRTVLVVQPGEYEERALMVLREHDPIVLHGGD